MSHGNQRLVSCLPFFFRFCVLCPYLFLSWSFFSPWICCRVSESIPGGLAGPHQNLTKERTSPSPLLQSLLQPILLLILFLLLLLLRLLLLYLLLLLILPLLPPPPLRLLLLLLHLLLPLLLLLLFVAFFLRLLLPSSSSSSSSSSFSSLGVSVSIHWLVLFNIASFHRTAAIALPPG